jgi:hypothetical protein
MAVTTTLQEFQKILINLLKKQEFIAYSASLLSIPACFMMARNVPFFISLPLCNGTITVLLLIGL